jgi:heavy metal sensor kinase
MSMSARQDDPREKRDTAADGPTIAALRANPGKALALTVSKDGDRLRVISRPLAVRGQPFMLAGVYPLNDVEDTLARIREMFLIAIPVLIIVAATGGYFLAKRSLAPVSSMAARAAEISATTLHERLPVAANDELGGLARVVNDLLDRLQQSFSQQQRFMADASHELRTPTAILRSEADVTLSREHRGEEEYRASVTIMQDAARRLTRIVDDLFLLARADTGHLVVHRDALYLEELMHDATRGVRQIADRRAVKVELGQVVEAPFHGDADLLGRLLLNLLDNAIKHSPDGGRVEVGMTRRNGDYAITVVDQGSGIPTDAHDRVFERFFRVDTARSRSENSTTSGAGLGLAIARRIAEVHGGRLELAESRPGRTEFRLTLPAG